MRLILLSVIQSILLCSGQVFLKLGLQKMGTLTWSWNFVLRQLTNWWWLGCGLCYLAASILWMYIVKNFSFSMAYPMISLSYILGMLAALFIFHEQIPATRWIGVFLIMSGCILVSK